MFNKAILIIVMLLVSKMGFSQPEDSKVLQVMYAENAAKNSQEKSQISLQINELKVETLQLYRNTLKNEGGFQMCKSEALGLAEFSQKEDDEIPDPNLPEQSAIDAKDVSDLKKIHASMLKEHKKMQQLWMKVSMKQTQCIDLLKEKLSKCDPSINVDESGKDEPTPSPSNDDRFQKGVGVHKDYIAPMEAP